MRVLYISHFGGLGGAERSLLELMIAVKALGIEPLLVCPAGALSRQASQAGIPVASWCARTLSRSRGPDVWWRSWPSLLAGWRELDQKVQRFRPDILHANSAQAMLWNGPVGWWRGCPVIWHLRDFHALGKLANVMASRADAIVAISNSILAFARDQFGQSARCLKLISNAVADLPPCDDAEKRALRDTMGTPHNAPLIVMAGQSVPRKGHAVLLQALVLLAKNRPDVRAWLVCDEHTQEAVAHTKWLREQASKLGCGPTVKITHGVEQIAPVLNAADVVAVPSLREPFGRIAVEAMLAGRPVVASAVDGLKEIVVAGEAGLLVPPNDPPSLAAGLGSVLDEPAIWASRGKAARNKALRSFSVSTLANNIVSLYSEVRQPGLVRCPA